MMNEEPVTFDDMMEFLHVMRDQARYPEVVMAIEECVYRYYTETLDVEIPDDYFERFQK